MAKLSINDCKDYARVELRLLKEIQARHQFIRDARLLPSLSTEKQKEVGNKIIKPDVYLLAYVPRKIRKG